MSHLRALPSNFRVALIVLVILACGSALIAQVPRPGVLRGQVADTSGGSIEGATVLLTTPTGQTLARSTDATGAFDFPDLAPGNYNLSVIMAGFGPDDQGVQIAAGQVQQLSIALAVAAQAQEVTVEEVAPTVDASASNNAGAVVMSGTDLEALSDDPDQLEADLLALAGPSAGPNGGQIFIDGFTGGRLPPKSSIREIRINSNPFSSEFDRMGFGRIEILTRPGTDAFHGRFNVQGNSSALNTWSPFVASGNRLPYSSISYDGNISGSVTSRGSFTFSAFRRNTNNSAVVNAVILDPITLTQIPFNASISTPQTRTNISPRFDYQLTRDNTLTARYQYSRNTNSNQGVGGFNLPTQAFDTKDSEHNIQLSDTQILGERAVNETRFRYSDGQDDQLANDPAPTLQVTGAFTGGGGNRASSTNTKNYEIQNYTSFIAGPHMLKFGGRVRITDVNDQSSNNFLGTYRFPTMAGYQLTQQGLAAGQTMAQIRADCVAAATLTGTNGNDCGPNQFTITTGTPLALANVLDLGLYLQDDWRLRPNLTLSGGLRFETQTKTPDKVDVAPRIGVAWAVGNQARPTVIRGGVGIFYSRFNENNVLQLARLNGVAQQQYLVANPDFYPTIPDPASLTGTQTSPTIYSLAANQRSPYIMQAAVSVERQLTRVINTSINFISSRGVHSLITNNINAPFPGSTSASNPLARPFGDLINRYQYQSAGSFRQNQLVNSINIRAGARLSIFGNYVLGYAHNDTATGGFPTNPYNLRVDEGRANNDIRHRVNLGGTMTLPWALRLSPLVTMQSSQPYNFTLGQDFNLDSQLNDRPSFADGATLAQNLVTTPFGNFDRAPSTGQTMVPVNYGIGPSRVAVNMRLGKTFTFGGSSAGAAPAAGGGPGGGGPGGGGFGGGAGRGGGGFGGGGRGGGGGAAGGARGRYTLTLNVDARNIFNKVNKANPTGNIGSPLFGRSNGLAGGPFSTGAAVRRIDLSLAFGF